MTLTGARAKWLAGGGPLERIRRVDRRLDVAPI
jgi:hypothetical protein